MTSKNDIKGLVSLKFLRPWDMAMRPIFRGFCINRFGIGPLHCILSRSDFGFEFAEIFVIEKRLADSDPSSWNTYSSVAKNRDTLRKEDIVNRDIFSGSTIICLPVAGSWDEILGGGGGAGGAEARRSRLCLCTLHQPRNQRQAGRLCFFRKLRLKGLCHEIEFYFLTKMNISTVDMTKSLLFYLTFEMVLWWAIVYGIFSAV